MSSKVFNRARMKTATTGTGTITLGTAATSFFTFATAGVLNGDVVTYAIEDGASTEVGRGTYTSSGTTLSRDQVYISTNSNAAINLSGTAEVFITVGATDGGDLLTPTPNPLRGFDTPVNLQLNASVGSNILTIAVKGNNGSDPSERNPVMIPFRDATIANGDPVWRAVTAALSITTNATGATLGTANSVAFRLWVVAFDNGGPVVLALWQSVTGGATPTAVAPLNEGAVASSTAISGSATAAGTFYTPNGTTVTSKAFRIIGYVDYASGLATAGTYASAPTTVQLFGPGIKKPGDILQTRYATNNTPAAATSTTKVQTSLSVSISPSSAMNLVRVSATGPMTCETLNQAVLAQLSRGTGPTLIGNFNGSGNTITGGGFVDTPATLLALDAPQTVSATTYVVFVWGTAAGTYDWNRSTTFSSAIEAQEVMV